jgi:hypothetical protein
MKPCVHRFGWQGVSETTATGLKFGVSAHEAYKAAGTAATGAILSGGIIAVPNAVVAELAAANKVSWLRCA